ncbi:Transcriptional regulator of ribosomal biogenesis proteins [Dimargaris cristalligena]|uniref:C2H2-type domain-containing protein n=1 Tax=Dimargaris cristalligena TaxID=215637 RepID=A0A4P9ZWI9_9FUNG|nr:Transcriptional regulator of ribosomal biogenesis proteins [Dimargaris cristalligena]RKP38025.1 hypothetical protein BJ085DRAFT_30997 [Dimargaris cristalligena]|eukprot:RKP38025.1 hypothetical protein BJ085DRAFT_30997 [Dimargaris cristalligena]
MPAPMALATSFKDSPLDLFDFTSASDSSGSCTPTNLDDDFFYPRELETTFCRDFSCCGLVLEDLHDLLQHYEECHVRLESDVPLETPALFEDGWTSSSDSDPSAHPSPYLKAATAASFMKHTGGASLYPEELLPYPQDELSLAAFDAAMLKAASALSIPPREAMLSSSSVPSTPTTAVSTPAPSTPASTAASSPRKKRPATSDADVAPRPAKKAAVSRKSKSASSSATSSDAESGAENGGKPEVREKPYRCPIEGCGKSYKNPNGLKYHNLHGHCQAGADGEGIPRPFTCTFEDCKKTYKNLNGLKYHVQHTHTPKAPEVVVAQEAIQV